MLSRRSFLGFSALLSCTALTSCGGAGFTIQEAIQACETDALPNIDDPVRVDMHVHLLNLKDLNESRFITSRELDLDERGGPILEAMVSGILDAIGGALQVTASSLEQERGLLNKKLHAAEELNPKPDHYPIWQSDGNFCYFASNDPELKGILRSNKPTQLTGVFATRIRNAARLMDLFPKVDLFTPAIVDMFEDEEDFNRKLRKAAKTDDPEDIDYKHKVSPQIQFYSNLALATRGRFLAYAPFNPARQYAFEKQKALAEKPEDFKDYFFWIERAVKHLGFIGVKVHPSQGFSPVRNTEFGCYDSSGLTRQLTDEELYDRFTKFDEYMLKLARLCKKLDVPILTHSGESISLNRRCMEGKPNGAETDPWSYQYRNNRFLNTLARFERRDEIEWTNSPKAWLELMIEAEKRDPDLPPLRVCLAHFANGFRDPMRHMEAAVAERLTTSPWLDFTAEKVASDRASANFFVDVSIIGELTKGGSRAQRRYHERYQDLFVALLKNNPKFAKRVMYGTDWHMPTVATIGDEFFDNAKSVVSRVGDEKLVDSFMGETAVRFLGLNDGGANRRRLETFFANAPNVYLKPRGGPDRDTSLSDRDLSVPLESIRWWDKAGAVQPEA